MGILFDGVIQTTSSSAQSCAYCGRRIPAGTPYYKLDRGMFSLKDHKGPYCGKKCLNADK